MEKIAIIGMGSSGMAVLAAYEKEVDPSKVSIDCYDSEESFGRGYPYREESEDVILNLKTRKISYDYQNNDDLANWHQENDRPEPVYTSRSAFGEYTRDRLEKTIANTKANKITERIVRMDKVGEQWELETEKGSVRRYDRVHLCNGEIPQRHISSAEKSDHYIQEIYPICEKLANIKPTDHVCVIGAGLTGVDVTTHLITEKKIEKVAMFSRSNVIPTVRVDPTTLEVKVLTMDKLQQILSENFGRISFEQFDELFTQELKAHDVDFERFVKKHMRSGIDELRMNIREPEELARVQALLPIMNLVFNKVWDSMGNADRVKFRAKYHPFMCLNRSPLPLESAEILIDAEERGVLSMPEKICGVELREDGKFVLRREDGSLDESIVFDYAINATGLDTSLAKVCEKNELLSSLLDKRYVMVDEYGGLAVVPENMAAISPRYGTLNNLHVHGVLASGVQYRNNSLLIMQMTAHRLIKELY
ncbi:MAG: FAD/NAD(P)-binding protein [Peptostreptococcaceae bacterium]|nr:FAD/NAD(P)-binding protein [Peptostreptococcaceae bacterium]